MIMLSVTLKSLPDDLWYSPHLALWLYCILLLFLFIVLGKY